MEKTIFSKKHTIFKISLVLTLMLFAFSFAMVQAMGVSAKAALSESEYGFEIDTGEGFQSGTYIRVTDDVYPTFNLTFNNQNFLGEKIFWYGVSDTSDIEGVDLWVIFDQDGNTVNPPYNPASGVGTLYLADIVQGVTNNNGGIYHKYMFFRSGALPVPGVEEDGVSYYYHEQVIEVCIDNNESDTAYKIDSLSATTQVGSSQTVYDLTSNEKVWVSSPITITVTNDAGQYDNANFYYQLNGHDPVKFQKVALTEDGSDVSTYYGEAKIPDPESGITSYEGPITVYSTSFADPDTRYVYDEKILNVYYDGEAPTFTVSATTSFGGKPIDYAEGSWASADVTYVIEPNAVASGATYYYSVYTPDGEIQSGPIQVQGEKLTYTVSDEGITSVTFSASSGAGVSYTAPTNQARIDKRLPKIAVGAVDGNGAEIRTMGTVPNSGYRVGYASDSITFTVTNQSSQQIGNDVEYFYSYDDVEYYSLPIVNGNYQLSQNNTVTEKIVNKTYYFKIASDSGYEDKYQFTVSVLNSNYYTLMEVEELYPNGAGWLKDEVNVSFTMPNVLGDSVLNGDDEYEIHGLVTGDTTTDKRLTLEKVSGAPVGYVKYNATIDVNLNESSYTFYVLDKANNRVDFNIDENGNPVLDENGNQIALRTTQLKLDLSDPSADIVSTINGTDTILTASDWSAGEVLITITPKALISGVNCYPIIGGIASLTPMTMTDGSFSRIVSESGVYSFLLMSGAGRQTTVSCTVNIDVSAIVFEDIIVSTIDKSGAIIQENIDKENAMIANDLLINFVTNHQGHFVFYYAQYTGSEPNLSESDYTLYVPQEGQDAFSMVIKMPEEGGSGFVKYAFMLRSMAQDTNGNVSQSGVKYISIQYDVRDFDIEISYSGIGSADQWVGTAPQFSLALNQSTTENITIAKYQYRLNDGEWIDINEDIVDNKVDFEFKGVKNYFNDDERLDSAQGDEAYASFNGTISFRALNAAGHSSRSLTQIVKMDTSTPSPLYAISQKAGEKVYDTTRNYYVLYSNQTIKYVPTGAEGIFEQKAPITYFYRYSTGLSDTSSNIDENTWSRLSGEVTLANGSYYWLYADNGLHRSTAYKVYVQIEDTKPTAEIISGGTVGAQEGVLEFNWTNRAEIQFKITSSTGVYIWYQLDGGEWQKVSETLVQVNGTNFQKIAFIPPEEGGIITEDFTIVGNVRQTARFKITNLSGSEYEVVNSVIIRIDSEEPEFDVNLSSASMPVITETDLASRWFSEAINIQIVPIGYNPGGVEYTYKVGVTGSYEKIGSTATFNTDNIIDFSGNGEVKIYVRAIASANLKTHERELTFKIDKVSPEFELKGEIKKGGVTTGSIVSEEWTNADEVLVSKVPNATSVSGVSYEIIEPNKGAANWNEDTPKSYKEITRITVIATSGAGLKVTKEFQVNIDNIAPIINAGPIVNNVDDPRNPYRYYIDQEITYTEANLKSAKYNNFPLSNGKIIATNTVDNSNGGLVHIVVEDLAGNKAELTFYMTIFDLTVNTIELNDDHIALLSEFEASYNDAKANLDDSRSQYFSTLIGRLRDRLATLEKEIADYQAYLTLVGQRTSFDLISDYPEMEKYLAYFISNDPLIVYPKWQQDKIREGYEDKYSKLVSEYNKLDALMSVVRDLQKEVVALPATNIVEEGDYQSVIRVYNEYQTLSNDQKAVFKSTLYTKLVELKRICEVYLLQDEDTGISIDGDHLVGESIGVMLEVLGYAESTELFANAQKTLYETVTEGNPRKIISINKLGLTGYGSQYDTGEITITLPIPNEGEIDYTEYVYFAVYRLSTDGTLSPVSNVMRSRDGKSVYFTSTTLDTYVLATTANVVVREDPETIYGAIGGIEIDATLLTYITFAVVALFVVFVVLMLLIALRRRKFLRAYNRDHKNSLQRRGISRIPKGNAPPPSNPARPEERVGDTQAVYYRNRRK